MVPMVRAVTTTAALLSQPRIQLQMSSSSSHLAPFLGKSCVHPGEARVCDEEQQGQQLIIFHGIWNRCSSTHTTRQTFQLHGALKHDLKTVMSRIIPKMGVDTRSLR